MNSNVKSKRHALLGALFIAAQERGINEQDLRDNIAPSLIGRRLSAASDRQIASVLDHIKGPSSRPSRLRGERKYSSSLQGLRDEIADLARERWGGEWERSLNNLCRRFGVDHFRFIDVHHGKAIKSWFRVHSAECRVQGEEHE